MAGRFSVEAVFKAVDRVTAPVTRMQNRVGKFTRSMQRGLRSVNRSLSKVTSSMRRVGVAAIKFAGVGLGAITAGVTLLIREFSKIEDAEAAFTPLLGGAAKAKQMIDELNETAASTPFQFETLSKSVSTLLPVMNGDIKNTIKTVRMLGDTAGGNAQKLESITRGFTKAMLKGKVDMESLNMIAEAGVPIFTELADSMGVKVNKAFFKMISAGKVTTQQLTKSFEKMTKKGGIFFKGMEISSKTTTGLFSTLKDNISLTAAEVGGVLAPTVKELIVSMTGVAQRVREWVKNNKELIRGRFVSFVQNIKHAVKGVIETLTKLNNESNIMDRLSSVVIGIGRAFKFLAEHGETILKITAGVIALSLALKGVEVVILAITLLSKANPIGLLITGLVAGAALIIQNWTPIKAFFIDLWDSIVFKFEVAINRITFIINKIKNIASDIISPISDFFSFNDEDETTRNQKNGATGPQIVTPQERVARSVEEQRTTSTAEVTIKDETGRAEVTGGKLGTSLQLQQSGGM